MSHVVCSVECEQLPGAARAANFSTLWAWYVETMNALISTPADCEVRGVIRFVRMYVWRSVLKWCLLLFFSENINVFIMKLTHIICISFRILRLFLYKSFIINTLFHLYVRRCVCRSQRTLSWCVGVLQAHCVTFTHDTLNNEYWIGKGVEGSGRGLIWDAATTRESEETADSYEKLRVQYTVSDLHSNHQNTKHKC